MKRTALIVVPVLRRPHRVAPLLASIAAATPEPHRVVFVCSPGDSDELAAVEASGADRIVLDEPPGPGDYARKINRAYRDGAEPFVFCGADDLAFRPGWLAMALNEMRGRIGVVGTQDLGNPRVRMGRHATHSLVRRTYADQMGTVDERGKILHEGYWHEFVDDELVETAKMRRAWAFAPGSVVEHLHPHWGKSKTDALYEQFTQRMDAGRRLYAKRRKLWQSPSR